MAAVISASAAAEEEAQIEPPKPSIEEKPSLSPSLASYLGLSFYVFLTFLPKSYHSHISSLQSRNKTLSLKLYQAEDQIRQMKSRRKEDSKANAKVVEIFASHRNGWQQEEKKLLHQIDASAQEIVHLRTKLTEMEKSEAELRIYVEKLQREVEERDEMIGFMSRKAEDAEAEKECEIRAFEGFLGRNVQTSVDFGDVGARIGKIRVSQGMDSISEVCLVERSSIEAAAAVAAGDGVMASVYGQSNSFGRDFVPSASLAAWTGEWGQVRIRILFFPLFENDLFLSSSSRFSFLELGVLDIFFKLFCCFLLELFPTFLLDIC